MLCPGQDVARRIGQMHSTRASEAVASTAFDGCALPHANADTCDRRAVRTKGVEETVNGSHTVARRRRGQPPGPCQSEVKLRRRLRTSNARAAQNALAADLIRAGQKVIQAVAILLIHWAAVLADAGNTRQMF